MSTNLPAVSTSRILAASLAGTAIEFYDFFFYGTAASLLRWFSASFFLQRLLRPPSCSRRMLHSARHFWRGRLGRSLSVTSAIVLGESPH